MQKSKIILDLVKTKQTRAYNSLNTYLQSSKDFDYKIDDLENISFKCMTALLYSFFDDNSVFVSVYPQEINRNATKWEISIFIDGKCLKESDFLNREMAEYIAFKKAFQFLDTKLFIEMTKNLFYDGSADSSCLNVDWIHLDKVLTYRRKNFING
jgi:hypothetical protein